MTRVILLFVWLIMIVGVPALGKSDKPLSLEIIPKERIYTSREGIIIGFQFRANESVQLCLEKDPFTQFKLNISRAGEGILPIEASTVKDNRLLFKERLKMVRLKPGDTYLYRMNIKRLNFGKGLKWEPGEYSVGATFFLCNQKAINPYGGTGAAPEIPIKAPTEGRFLIMN